MKEKILITAALPYANAALHFGHLAGVYLPADTYRRYCLLKKKRVLAVCGSDEYGMAIVLSARLNGKTPSEQAEYYHAVNHRILEKMAIVFDSFSRTTNPCHIPLVQSFFQDLYDKQFIEQKEASQLYCEKTHEFLADRYVVGTCPKCGFENARGDECPSCSAYFESTELKNPRSKIGNHPLVLKNTTHLYLNFDQFKHPLSDFLATKDWKKEVMHFASHYVDDLKPRCITRDLTWGVPVPLDDFVSKVFYVWFDAPIGYISISQYWAETTGDPDAWKDFWLDSSTQYTQFLGKDNIPFHAVFFPAMTMGQTESYKLVDDLVANHFYQLEGRQFSKSDRWTIDVEDFLTRYPVDVVRYSLAASCPETGDSEFTFKQFQMHHNVELLGKLGNFINRVLTFIQSKAGGKIPSFQNLENQDLKFENTLYRIYDQIDQAYEGYSLRKATHLIMEMADEANAYFNSKAPWKDAKDPSRHFIMNNTLYESVFCIKLLATAIAPIMPSIAQTIAAMIASEITTWEGAKEPLKTGILLPKPTTLFEKIEDSMIEKEAEKLKESLPKQEQAYTPLKSQIEFDDFMKLDLRVGEIKEATKVEKSKKLLKLSVDLGFETRTIVSGISLHYAPEDLIGKKVVVVANLKPAKLMGIESQGMILAGGSNSHLELLQVNSLEPGSEVS